MKLDMFNMQLNEDKVSNKIGDLHSRVRELRALKNSCDAICKKIASEFGKDYDSVKKLLLPADLKPFVGMTTEELNKVGEERIKKLKIKFSKCAPTTKRSRAGFLNGLMDACVCRG